jgi:hypothetical protein
VLAVAWRSFLRHYLALVILCIAAGFAGRLAAEFVGVMLPAGFGERLPAISLRGHSPVRELVQISLATLVVTPALVLLSQSYAGQAADFRSVMEKSGRRVMIVVLCEAAVDLVLVTPAYFFLRKPGLLAITDYPIYLIYEIPLRAFNYIFLATLAVESINPLAALRRTFLLMRGRWWQMYSIAFLVSLTSIVIFAVARYADAAFDWSQRWQVLIIRPMSFGFRLLVIIPVAAAAYRLLRHEKDGPPLPETAQIFD